MPLEFALACCRQGFHGRLYLAPIVCACHLQATGASLSALRVSPSVHGCTLTVTAQLWSRCLLTISAQDQYASAVLLGARCMQIKLGTRLRSFPDNAATVMYRLLYAAMSQAVILVVSMHSRLIHEILKLFFRIAWSASCAWVRCLWWRVSTNAREWASTCGSSLN